MEVINFCKENWTIIAPVLALLISEIMAMNPNWKGNGILHGVLEMIKKK